MKAYKVELLIIDFDGLGMDGIIQELNNANFPNDCMHPHVMDISEKDIGRWTDDHPLNQREQMADEYKKLFPS